MSKRSYYANDTFQKRRPHLIIIHVLRRIRRNILFSARSRSSEKNRLDSVRYQLFLSLVEIGSVNVFRTKQYWTEFYFKPVIFIYCLVRVSALSSKFQFAHSKIYNHCMLWINQVGGVLSIYSIHSPKKRH